MFNNNNYYIKPESTYYFIPLLPLPLEEKKKRKKNQNIKNPTSDQFGKLFK